MERNEAISLLNEYLDNKNLVKHCIAVEAGMKKCAEVFDLDGNRYAEAGLLHDLDYDLTKDNFSRHGYETGEILKKIGYDDAEILQAIVEHSGNVPPTSTMGKFLYAVDPATGFLIACVLMHPDKKLSSLEIPFIMKRFKEKRFAKGANRDQIASITAYYDISVERFLEIVRDGMREYSDEIGF